MTGARLAARARPDVPLAPLTTYKFGGAARWYAEVADGAELSALVAAAPPGLPRFVLGRGSNVVVSDHGFAGLVVRLSGRFLEVAVGSDGIVTAGGGASLPRVARVSVRAGRGGLEFYVGIPGTVGGAVRMNAGCHGTDTAAWLQSVDTVDLRSGRPEQIGADRLGLTYRHSDLDPDAVVVAARYRTVARPPEEGEAAMREITAWRKQHQPGGTLNAGSVFKNPPGDAAGRLIDAAGLKGFRVGGAHVSARHANFFEADPAASAQDLYDLVWAVRRRVFEAAGVRLEPELRFVGEFRPSPDEALG